MPSDFTFQIHLRTLLEKFLVMLLCWSNKMFKKYEDVIQIMMPLFFMPINLRSLTRWIWNIKSKGISYSWYFLSNLLKQFDLAFTSIGSQIVFISILGLLKRSTWLNMCCFFETSFPMFSKKWHICRATLTSWVDQV